jgi:NDP-sugar pyrophosphorylase family protein
VSKALLLAAGMGSRLRSITGDLPKPLAPFAGAPIITHNLQWLAASGVRDVWINLHYQAGMIREAIGDGSAFGLTTHYVYEPELLGTAGALANIAQVVDDDFLVVYSDNIIRCDLSALKRAGAQAKAECTVALFDQDRHSHTGIAGGRVLIDGSGAITGFTEGAPANESGGSSLVNAGVYALQPSILDLIPTGGLVDFGRDVFPAMLATGRRLQAYVIEDGGFCLGLDTPKAFSTGQALIDSGRIVLT